MGKIRPRAPRDDARRRDPPNDWEEAVAQLDYELRCLDVLVEDLLRRHFDLREVIRVYREFRRGEERAARLRDVARRASLLRSEPRPKG